MADDFGIGAVRIHANRKSPDVYVTVVAFRSSESGGIVRIGEWADRLGAIGTKNGKCFTRLVGEFSSAVSRIEIPFPVGADGNGVE